MTATTTIELLKRVSWLHDVRCVPTMTAAQSLYEKVSCHPENTVFKLELAYLKCIRNYMHKTKCLVVISNENCSLCPRCGTITTSCPKPDCGFCG